MSIFKHFSLKKVALGLIVAAGLVFAGNVALKSNVLALPTDCQTNSIIRCGVQSREEFRDKYNASAELKALYAHTSFYPYSAGAGLQGDDINRFVSKGKEGKLNKNGDLIVDGVTVAKNSWSLGRESHNSPYRYPITVPGAGTYYYGTTQVSFGEKTTSLPVFVLFNDDGVVEFAAITACGNITWGENQTPTYDCKSLKSTPVEGKQNTYNFITETSEDKGAVVTKVAYNFNDGTPVIENTNKAGKFAQEHTFTKAGSYTVTVSVTVSLPGGATKTFTREWCQTKIEVKQPVYKCDALAGKLISGNRKYRFELKATAKDGAKLTSVNFDFGDGQKANNIKPPVETGVITMSIDHQYAAELFGKKTITADLAFNLAGENKSQQCKVEIDLKKETCEDKPKDTPECQPPIEYCKPGIPKDDDRCKEILPKEIVKTGPAEIAATAVGMSAVAGAGMYYRASRRTFIDSLLKRK